MHSQNQRISRLKNILKEEYLDAIIISSVPNIIYLTGYAGFSSEEREAYLIIIQNEQYILTDGRYSTAIKKQVADFKLIELTASRPFYKAIQELCKKHNVTKLGIEATNLTVAESEKIKQADIAIQSVNLQQLRIHKESHEIAAIYEACRLGDLAFSHIIKQIKTGITEKKLSFLLEMFIKEHNADLAFPPIIAFGPNAAVPHHTTSDQRLTTNDFVLLDFGVKVNNYCSDMTRTVFLGKATKEQKRMYETVLHSQQKVVEHLNNVTMKLFNNKTSEITQPIKASELDTIARNHIISCGYPSIPHSLGHGIGLEVHEPPTLSPHSKSLVGDGMVFSIEPGIYIPELGGIRIEDLFTIDNSSLRQLTNAPKNLLEL